MTSRIITWACNNKRILLCGVCLCLIVSTLCVGAVASAQNAHSNPKYPDSLTQLTSSENSSKAFYRLPRKITPKNYKLTLWPDMGKKMFSGAVVIRVEVSEATQSIQLHSNKLDIKSVSFRGTERHVPVTCTHMSLDRRELLVVELFEEVPKGTYEIYISFRGKLDNGIVGFYASTLKNKK